jgi:signal transduction histidine kinase
VPSSRPLAVQLATSHALIGLLTCTAMGFLLAWLLPEVYLRQRQASLVEAGRAAAAEVAPALARHEPIRSVLVGSREVSSVEVVDAQGRIVAASAPPGARGLPLGLGRIAGGASCAVMALDARWRGRWPDVLAGKVVQGRVALPDHDAVFVAALPVQHAKRVIGAVVIYARLADLRDTAVALLPLVAIASLVVALLAMLASGLLSHRMARPLRRMTEAAQQVSQGDLSLTVEAPAWEEGEALARAFNQMTASIAAQEASRRQFIADASHQLRAPLTSLQAQAEALLDGLVQDEATRRRFLTRMVEDVKGLSTLAQDLLDLERLESGPRAPQCEALDVAELLRDLAETFTADGSASVSVEAPEALPPVWADPSEVRQAVSNLVNNALKYCSPEGHVRLTARAAGSSVRVSVSDDGPGLSPEQVPLVWERFYRVPGDTTRGSGLGLPIVKRIVERQGGCVGVDTVPGQGCAFWFDLPAASA